MRESIMATFLQSVSCILCLCAARVVHAAPKVDPVEQTQKYLTELIDRIDTKIAKLDTTAKKEAAHKTITNEIRQKTLTFRFTIKDATETYYGSGEYVLAVEVPKGLDGYQCLIGTITLPFKPAEAEKINKGDTLVLSGKGDFLARSKEDVNLGAGSSFLKELAGGRHIGRERPIGVGAYVSEPAGFLYNVGVTSLKFSVERRHQ